MDTISLVAIISIIAASITITIGTIMPAYGEMRSIEMALKSIAQQPDVAAPVTRALFVGLAMIESMAIYCLVISMILIFANPFWNYFVAKAAG